MATLGFLLVGVILSTVFASDVPVLMWSPDRPLSDLPEVPAADSVSQDHFHGKYLSPLLGKKTQVIIAFIQDKLHVNDISKYADVYNQESDGGAFKNVKGLLDENFSLELPHVHGSHIALDMLRQDFPGKIHDATDESDFSELDFTDKGNYLVIVHLKPVAGAANEEAAIASNDDLIGKVSRHLEKRNVRYTALYTAETSDEKKRDRRSARKLMDASVSSDRGYFYNVTYGNDSNLYLYMTGLSLCIIETKTNQQPNSCPFNFTIPEEELSNINVAVESEGNRTLRVLLTANDIRVNNSAYPDTYNFTLMLPIKDDLDRWEILDAEIHIRNSSFGDMVTNETLVMHGYDPIISRIYSFHCTSLELYPKNNINVPRVYLVLKDFQIQPFNVTSTGFLLSQDCMGWFSTAIWMALFPVGIHVIILLFGLYMILSLSTNDRFDDPKGKTLTINAGE